MPARPLIYYLAEDGRVVQVAPVHLHRRSPSMTAAVRVDCGMRHPFHWLDRSEARLGLRIAGNGSYNLLVWCVTCDRWASGAVGLHVLEGSGIGPADLPVIADYRGVIGRCARLGCDREAVEDHHFAPRAKFGEEADDWPRALLCREHHIEWHRRMGAV